MLIEDLASAPNPQFARPQRLDLNGEWRFRFDDENVGLGERWFDDPSSFDLTITVPYPPESRLSGVHETGFHPVLWYARQFDPSELETDASQHLFLNFGAVDYQATVWVDGVQVGEHTGGHTPFHFDISWALADGDEHWIVVRAWDDPHDIEQPRGKQEWLEEPHVIWYHRTSGIWQSVWIEPAPAVHIETLRWRFDAERWLLDYEVELSGAPVASSSVTISLQHEGKELSFVTAGAKNRTVIGQMSLGDVIIGENRWGYRWSPGNPVLLGVEATLSAPNVADDLVQSYVGLRTVETNGRRILINGQSVFLRLVLQQGYWPESQIAAPSPEALKREVELIQELGFNGARIHQKIEDPRFLYWADRLGLLLWGEAANAFTYSERAIDRHTVEWREAVLRDRNHPSIIAWVPFNESWGVGELKRSAAQRHAVSSAYHKTHQLDGTRPVIGNDGWENTEGDIVGIHDYTWDEQTLTNRYGAEERLEQTIADFYPGARNVIVGDFDPAGKPVLVTEFGGVSYAPNKGENWFGYGQVKNQDEYIQKYRALVGALHDSSLLAGFCYTQFTDTEQEINGLLDENRNPKVPMEVIREITIGNKDGRR